MSTADFDPGPLAAVDYLAEGDRWTLVFVKELSHPPERVWAALTEPDRLQQWSPFDASRDLACTGPATLTMVNGDEVVAMETSVTRAEAPVLLEYTWGTDLLQWHLEARSPGTRLTLRHTVADREMGPKVAAGWHLCLVVMDQLLAGTPIGRVVGDDAMSYGWSELRDTYAVALGISEAPEDG